MQTKRHSFIETAIQVVSGYFLSLLLQIVIFPLYGIQVSLHQNIQIGIWFTVAMFIKGYVVRRLFNRCSISVRKSPNFS